MEAEIPRTSWALILGRSDWEEFSYVRRMVSATHLRKCVVNNWVLGVKCTKSFSRGSVCARSADLTIYSPRARTGQRSLSGSLGKRWAIPGKTMGSGMTSGRWFLGINLGTILMETCFAPEGNMVKSRLCEARERATSSEPRALEARATKKAVLYDNSSRDIWRSDPLMVKGGFIRPFKTTLRCHRGRTSCSRGQRMVIRRMTFCRVFSWSVVGGFNSLSTLEIEALWTRMILTFLFKEKRCTRYSANVMKDRSFGWRPFSLAQIAKAFQWEL